MSDAAADVLCDVPAAMEELRQGRMVVVVDDEHRENEGDLILAAEMATPQALNFMTMHGRGPVSYTHLTLPTICSV